MTYYNNNNCSGYRYEDEDENGYESEEGYEFDYEKIIESQNRSIKYVTMKIEEMNNEIDNNNENENRYRMEYSDDEE